jgi:hypothetical protein
MSKCVNGEVLSDAEGTHALAIIAAETLRQGTRGTTQATATAADLVWARTVIASARANGSNRNYEPALSMLRSLGAWS